MADAVAATRGATSRAARPERPGRVRAVPDATSRWRWWTAGSRARCRTRIPTRVELPHRRGLRRRPARPLVGLPDCDGRREPGALAKLGRSTPASPPTTCSAGVPVPRTTRRPSTPASRRPRRPPPGVRLGDILLTVCSCEQWDDQSQQHPHAHRPGAGQQVDSATTGERVHAAGDGTWSCPDPRDPSSELPPIVGRRVQAHARPGAQRRDRLERPRRTLPRPSPSRPTPTQIKGNYTTRELPAEHGYRLTVAVGMANDYNGYIATYREYQRGDHYRKALTGWGPHSSDYMATRLVRMGGQLNGGAGAARRAARRRRSRPTWPTTTRARRRSATSARPTSTGLRGAAAGRRRRRPRSSSSPRTSSASARRSSPGSAARTTPTTRGARAAPRRRRLGGLRRPVRRGAGHAASYPQAEERAGLRARAASAGSGPRTSRRSSRTIRPGRAAGSTPAGTYRFVVDGLRRRRRQAVPYRLTRDEFEVAPWDGITVEDLARSTTPIAVSFAVGPEHHGRARSTTRTPTTSPAPFIAHNRTFVRDPAAPDDASRFEWYCLECSFRPWADTGEVDCAQGTVVSATGSVRRARASQAGDRWVVPLSVAPGRHRAGAAGRRARRLRRGERGILRARHER